ncbi:MAG: DUF4129 domain-containing protein [Candidatus Eremiobacteraeota bacterium]|nr:DUF4129 domain-containing protein [Candidatus Eremiobacteraeota bacterium]
MIAGIAVLFALATPSRDALIERWLRADPAHSAATLSSAPAAAVRSGVPNLHALATRELTIPGRYQIALPRPPLASEPWWLRAGRWMFDRWKSFWDATFARFHIGRPQAAGIGDALLALVGLVVIFILIRLLLGVARANSQPPAGSAPLEESPPPRALYRLACDAADRGDYATAALRLFAATVALLERRGTLQGATSATVGDVRRVVRARNAASVASFDAVASPFVQTAYAERPIDEAQWQRARDAFNGLLQRGTLP